MRKTDMTRELRDREAELLDELNKVHLAMDAFGINHKRGQSGPSVVTTGTVTRRTRKPREIEAEIRRVLTRAKRPMVVREIMDSGSFSCTPGGVFSAADRMEDVQSAGKARYQGHTSTAFKLKEMRLRAGEGQVDGR